MPVAPLRINGVEALEVLDSRGRPTLQVTLRTDDGRTASAGVPSGASTGRREAVELRDGDAHRYGGQGVRTAAAAVNGEIARLLGARSWPDQAALDRALVDLDGTPTKKRLGANAIVGVSVAAARLLAADDPLWTRFVADGAPPRLPVPHFNVLNGGAHAANRLDFQEFMIAPIGAGSLAEAIRCGAEVYAALHQLVLERLYGAGLGDEGGFAADVTEPEQALDLLVTAIGAAGYRAHPAEVAIAIDPAASQFQQADGRYLVAGRPHTSAALVDRYAALVEHYPVWSIEDGMAEDDHEGWRLLHAALGNRIQIMGDDLFVTDADSIRQGARAGLANSALIKLNQVGTVTETLAAVHACQELGLTQMISHRSGETVDDVIADLAVGCGCGQLKAGAPARGERVAKYNRLLRIARDRPDLPYGLTPSPVRSTTT